MVLLAVDFEKTRLDKVRYESSAITECSKTKDIEL